MISALVQKMSAYSDASEDAAIDKAYYDLSADELLVFDSLKKQDELRRMIDSAGYSEETALAELSQAWSMRKILQQQSLKEFKLTVNKLSVEQLRSLEAPVTRILIDQTPALKERKTTGSRAGFCKYFHPTGSSCYKLNIYYRTRTSCGKADNNVWAPICDSEHWYRGNNPNGVYGSDYNSRKAILYYGCLSRWWTGTNTGILIGFWAVDVNVGTHILLRMVAF